MKDDQSAIQENTHKHTLYTYSNVSEFQGYHVKQKKLTHTHTDNCASCLGSARPTLWLDLRQ